MVPAAMTGLQATRDQVGPYFDILFPRYKDYCMTVSRRGMAASIETVAYMWWLCDQIEAVRVLDMGSGFSSYVLRCYQAKADHAVEVVSVDDSPEWLARTRDWLTRCDLPADGLVWAPDWRDGTDTYDLVFYDYAGGPARIEWMWDAAKRLNPGGVLLFDDAQHPGHHFEMARVATANNLHLFDVYGVTVDDSGRYAAMAHA
jgi:predicted O-methyltransferase YrrM